jgi:hypothetical protein
LHGAAFDIAMSNHNPVAFELAAREVGHLSLGIDREPALGSNRSSTSSFVAWSWTTRKLSGPSRWTTPEARFTGYRGPGPPKPVSATRDADARSLDSYLGANGAGISILNCVNAAILTCATTMA